ncbi:MAG: 30S ribosomal protein S6 [Clostridia bacterium]|nr:30S ribosomal protein S6 [Clostridia bacterium]MBR2397739.1 30S ribosomal protein S6 [Clostridia bacterium]MBR6692549.1 30S ribosomal protein S6 [Clostridia bacterium]
MNKYELLYIIDRDVADENRAAAMKMVEDTIVSFGGNVAEVDVWGMRKFAYPINYKTEGYYVLLAFEADPSSIKELERRMRVNDAFVRFMTTSVIENKKTEKAKTVKKASKPERVAKKPVETEEVVAETKED